MIKNQIIKCTTSGFVTNEKSRVFWNVSKDYKKDIFAFLVYGFELLYVQVLIEIALEYFTLK